MWSLCWPTVVCCGFIPKLVCKCFLHVSLSLPVFERWVLSPREKKKPNGSLLQKTLLGYQQWNFSPFYFFQNKKKSQCKNISKNVFINVNLSGKLKSYKGLMKSNVEIISWQRWDFSTGWCLKYIGWIWGIQIKVCLPQVFF